PTFMLPVSLPDLCPIPCDRCVRFDIVPIAMVSSSAAGATFILNGLSNSGRPPTITGESATAMPLECCAPAGEMLFNAGTGRWKNLRRAAAVVGIECRSQPQHHAQVFRREHP